MNNFTTSRSIKVGDRVVVGDAFDPALLRTGLRRGCVYVVTVRHPRTHRTPVLLEVAEAATGVRIPTPHGYRWFAPAPQEG